jgi:MoaA/NifB/PqqE/SkfB family radical SAM enzyme
MGQLLKISRREGIHQGKKLFDVNWMLHNRCTYDCSYCPSANKKGTDSWLRLENVKEFCTDLDKYRKESDPGSEVEVIFNGGEPTVWKDFIPLVDYCNSLGWHVVMNTNASRSLRWWEENVHKFSWLVLSYHTETVNDDEFIEKIKLCEKYVKTSINVMLNPEQKYFEKAVKFSHRLYNETSDVNIQHHEIQHNFGLDVINVPHYTQEQLSVIRSLRDRYPDTTKRRYKTVWQDYVGKWDNGHQMVLRGNELIKDQQNTFKGWKCYQGREGLFIDALGDVNIGACRVGGSIGNIQTPKEIKWPTGPVICPLSSCTCVTDILKTKSK